MSNTVSLEIAKSLSRRGWQKGQTKKQYKKACHSSVYSLEDQNIYICDYDAPDIVELNKMCNEAGFNEAIEIMDIELKADLLLKFLSKNKIKLNHFKIS